MLPSHRKSRPLEAILVVTRLQVRPACLRGKSVLFANAIDVINTLSVAQNKGTLKVELRKYLAPSRARRPLGQGVGERDDRFGVVAGKGSSGYGSRVVSRSPNRFRSVPRTVSCQSPRWRRMRSNSESPALAWSVSPNTTLQARVAVDASPASVCHMAACPFASGHLAASAVFSSRASAQKGEASSRHRRKALSLVMSSRKY